MVDHDKNKNTFGKSSKMVESHLAPLLEYLHEALMQMPWKDFCCSRYPSAMAMAAGLGNYLV